MGIATSETNDSSEMNLTAKREQLKLAYEWRQIDIVTRCIIINERDWQVKNSIDKSMVILLLSSIENRIERSVRESSERKSSGFRSIVSRA